MEQGRLSRRFMLAYTINPRKSLMIRTMSASLLAALAACTTAPASQEAPAAPVITGGYGSADLDDAWVKAAQTVAVNEIYTRNPTRALVEKVSVQQQVVAGINYAFDITMSGGGHFKVTVYRDLQGKMEVTAFEKVG